MKAKKNLERMARVVIPKSYEGERLDKFVMYHFGMPWTAAHRLIRTKLAFVQKEKPASEEEKFVYKD